MVWRPDTSDARLGAHDGLCGAAVLVAAGVAQQLDLLQNLVWRQVSYADGFCAAVDVVSDDDGVSSRARRNCEFDLGGGCGDLGEQ